MWKSLTVIFGARVQKKKGANIPPKQVTALLNSFLNTSKPEMVKILTKTWGNQQNAITYKDLREAIKYGYLPQSFVDMWQKSYSQLVVQEIAPQWEAAIAAAGQNITAKYGAFAIDLSRKEIGEYIKQHGAEFVTNVSDEQRKAMNAMIRRAALAEDFTVDELARAIRPTIGLTVRQSNTLASYYGSLRKHGYSHKEAMDMQLKRAERMHRDRAQVIADFELTKAYNNGNHLAVKQAIADGYMPMQVKKWSTDATESVCPICGALDGTTVALDADFNIPDKFFSKKIPPIHPHCHCCLTYEDAPGASKDPPPGTVQIPVDDIMTMTEDEIIAQYAPKPQIPAKDNSIQGLHYVAPHKLGTGQMYLLNDQSGNPWLFKPATSKSGHYEPFRAYVQEAGYKVQAIIDPDTAVTMSVGKVNIHGKMTLGAAQPKIDTLPGAVDLRKWQHKVMAGGVADDLADDILAQLQRESVTDWLMCNYDAHGGNFIFDMSGRMIGVDKEQAFRYIFESGAKKLSYSFHPNAKYGETEPIYNTIYRKFAQGKLELDLNNALAAIKRIEAVPDADYREIFREYAEMLHGKGFKAEKLLDAIVERKQTARKTFESFYSELMTERKGKKVSFKFADTATKAATVKVPAAASSMSVDVLDKMAITDLQKIGQAQKLPMWSKMSKQELVTALSDPTKAADMAEACRQRTKAQRAARTAARQTPTVSPAPTPNSVVEGVRTVEDALGDLDDALDKSSVSGVPLVSDSSVIDGLQVNLRRYTIGSDTYYEISGKMTEKAWRDAEQRVARLNLRAVDRQFYRMTNIDYATGAVTYSDGLERLAKIPVHLGQSGDDVFMMAAKSCASDARSFMGEFSLRVKASDGGVAGTKLRDMISKYGLDDILKPTTKADVDTLKTMRIIWQNDAKLASDITRKGLNPTDISAAAKKMGITQARLDAMKVRKISGGYYTFVDPEIEKVLNARGVAYAWSGVTDCGSMTAIIKSGELIASNYRLKRGVLGSGASVSSDIRTGGADNVFCRIALNKNVGAEKYRSSFSGGPYRVLIKRDELLRTDWYAYTSDEFGTTQDGEFLSRRSVDNHFAALSHYYAPSNEVMFRRSVNIESFFEIRCHNASDRVKLINSLHAEHITHINGVQIEKFIKVGSTL